jgi:hypothetical protein
MSGHFSAIIVRYNNNRYSRFGGFFMFTAKNVFQVLALMLITALVTVGCTTGTPEPTLDPAVIYTEAAQTVAAQLTMDAPPTQTPEPTAIPTNTPVPPTSTPLPERPTETPQTAGDMPTTTPIPQPTATRASSSGELIDDAILTYFYPPDDQVFTADGFFNAQVGFQNMGPITWNEDYSLRYLSGNTFGVGSKFVMDDFSNQDVVAPGSEVIFTIPNMKAPSEEGRYLSNWCLYNNREAQGLAPQCFYLITFQIIVDNP